MSATVAMNKKRSAPSVAGAAGAANPPKKRKVDTAQKFYAVKAGVTPGVYLTYAECQQQTAGFKGALCGSTWRLAAWGMGS